VRVQVPPPASLNQAKAGKFVHLWCITLFYYYAGHDPLSRGVGVPGLMVLGLVTAALTGVVAVAFERRDLRA
jgi:hypothetical protein